jgi:hypothetical protein
VGKETAPDLEGIASDLHVCGSDSSAESSSDCDHPLFEPLLHALRCYLGPSCELKTTIPPWASSYGAPNKWWACLDVLSLPLKDGQFQTGLFWARKHILRLDGGAAFAKLYCKVMSPKDGRVDVANATNLCLERLTALEEALAAKTDLRGPDLENAMKGFHYGIVVSTIANHWQIVLEHFDKELFMSSVLDELRADMSSATKLHQWLEKEDGHALIKLPVLGSMLQASMFGRIQLICYRCEFLVTWMQGFEEVQDCYERGTATWQLGWFRTPPAVCDIIQDILRERLE